MIDGVFRIGRGSSSVCDSENEKEIRAVAHKQAK